jgi:MFS family permease
VTRDHQIEGSANHQIDQSIARSTDQPMPSPDSPFAWRMLGALAVAELLGMSLWFSATAVTPSLAQAFALSASESAWLTMAVQAGFVAATLLTAFANLADLVNPRTLIGVGCLIGAAANASALMVGSPSALIATRVATGAALAWVYPPAMKVAAGWFRLRRGFALGMLVGALTLGKAMPHLVSALFGADWRTPMLFTSALAIAGAAVALWIVGDGPLLPAPSRFDARAVRRVFAVREVRLATAGYLGHMWELYAMWAWVAAFAAASLAAAGSSAPARDAALVAFVAIGSGAAGCAVAGRLADSLGKARVARLALAASGVCCLASAAVYGRHPAWLFALVALWGFAVVADSAQFSALVSEHAPADAIGTALTLQTSIGFLLTMVTIDVLPRAAATVGWQYASWLLALGPIAGYVAMGRFGDATGTRDQITLSRVTAGSGKNASRVPGP